MNQNGNSAAEGTCIVQTKRLLKGNVTPYERCGKKKIVFNVQYAKGCVTHLVWRVEPDILCACVTGMKGPNMYMHSPRKRHEQTCMRTDRWINNA